MTGQPVSATTTALFSSKVVQLLRSDQIIVDFGAGNDGSVRSPLGIVSKYVREVIAIDIESVPPELPSNVEWRQERIEDWLYERSFFPSGPFHGFIARNSLQFLERDFVLNTLLPWLRDCVEPGGFIALATFYRAPDPPVNPPYRSLFHLEELRQVFPPNWKSVLAVEEVLCGSGYYNRTLRNWYTTQLVIKRPC